MKLVQSIVCGTAQLSGELNKIYLTAFRTSFNPGEEYAWDELAPGVKINSWLLPLFISGAFAYTDAVRSKIEDEDSAPNSL